MSSRRAVVIRVASHSGVGFYRLSVSVVTDWNDEEGSRVSRGVAT